MMIRFCLSIILITNTCFAQIKKVTVQNTNNEKLTNVSILKKSTVNAIVAITDSLGTSTLTLDDDETYLFHLLGYEDLSVTGKEIRKSSALTLQTSNYQLQEVKVKPKKLKSIWIKNKPGNWAFGEDNRLKKVFDMVSLVDIKNIGYLKTFSLYAKQNMPGYVRIFKFIIFTEKDGKPDKPIIDKSINGILKGGKITFDLEALNIMLEKEKYFIGYETVGSGLYNSSEEIKHISKTGKIYIETPMIHIKGNFTDNPNTFRRDDLNKWMLFSNRFKESDKQYLDFAYELEMEIEIEQ